MFSRESKLKKQTRTSKGLNFLLFSCFCSILITISISHAAPELDKSKYISVDEIKPGMKAYCLTCYKGTKIERFELDVLDVIRNFTPGRDAILVQGTDERFIHTGPVAGCSGSPVYIDGRLAGALAFGWKLSKDPLYGVTPIGQMHSVGEADNFAKLTGHQGFAFDFSAPVDFSVIYSNIKTQSASAQNLQAGASFLPSPLITTSLPASVCDELNELFSPFGITAVSGGSAGSGLEDETDPNLLELKPGGSLAVPIVSGDISMAVVGTVTEIIGDDVYGFGHSFLYQGYGPVSLPMATARVHTVVSNLSSSFKFASTIKTVGALTADEKPAVRGKIGAKADMIPLTITVDRYNATDKQVYNCMMVDNKTLTLQVLGSAVSGAVLQRGSLPPDHTIEYKVNIAVEGEEPITFENISTRMQLNDMLVEAIGSVALLMNNPYKKANIKSLDFDIRVIEKNLISKFWSVELSDSKVKAGDSVDISVVVESIRSPKKKYSTSIKIPQDTEPGEYKLIISGADGYERFLRKNAPYSFLPLSFKTLIEALNNILEIKRDRIYCILVLSPSGVTLQKAQLPDLPATKALILRDAKRAMAVKPYQHWSQTSMQTGSVVFGRKILEITVEK